MKQGGIQLTMMDKIVQSLLATPSKPLKKKKSGFLDLPGELRNDIYDYYFSSFKDTRCEIAAEGCDFNQQYAKFLRLCMGIFDPEETDALKLEAPKSDEPTTLRVSRRLGKYKRIDGLQTQWPTSLCPLILVCKQIHVETISFLYNNITFVFESPSRMTTLFGVAARHNLAHVTRLHLHYNTYGNPQKTVHVPWKEKHLASWTRACKAATKVLVNLQELEVWASVYENPIQCDLRQQWVQPLLQFRRLTRPLNKSTPGSSTGRSQHNPCLKIVKVHVSTYCVSPIAFPRNPILAKASLDLHRLYGQAISGAILGMKEKDAMAGFMDAWENDYDLWQHHLNFARTGW